MKTIETKKKGLCRRERESINPAVILSDILLLCSLQPSGPALMSLSHSEPRICVYVCVCVHAYLCEGQKSVHRSIGEQEDNLMSSFRNGSGTFQYRFKRFRLTDTHTPTHTDANLKACHCPSRCDQVCP